MSQPYEISLGSPHAPVFIGADSFIAAVIKAHNLRHYTQGPVKIALACPLDVYISTQAGHINSEEIDRVYQERLR